MNNINIAVVLIIYIATFQFSCNAQISDDKLDDKIKRIVEANNEIKELQYQNDSLTAFIQNSAAYKQRGNFDFDVLSAKFVHKRKSYTMFIVDPKQYRISLFNQNEKTGDFFDFPNIKKEIEEQGGSLLFAMNAGMYKPDRTPQGLYINNGKTYSPVDTVKLNGQGNFYDLPPNGILIITNDNEPQVIKTDDYLKLDSSQISNIRLASQSGPMMVIDGKKNNYFTEGSHNLHVRNAVGVNQEGDLVFIISNDKVNFYEFAELYQFLGCSNALYLDGAISTATIPLMLLPSASNKDNKLPYSSHLGPIIAVYK